MNPLHNPGFSASLNFGHLTLEGYAVSAVASYIMAPTLNACFDLGHCPVAALPLSNIFLSHVHKDHSAGVPLYFSLRDMQKMGKAKVFVPSGSRGGLLRTLEAFDSMEGPNVPDRSGEVIGVSPGDVISLGRSYKVRVFDSIHRIESVGYTVFEHRSKLKPQYLGLSPAEIVKAKQLGEEVTEVTEKNLLTYIGDSTLETLVNHPEVGLSDVLILEATHLGGDTLPQVSTDRGHTHLSQLAELWEKFPEPLASPRIVLKHFSMRYWPDDVRKALETLPKGLAEKVTPLLPS